VNRRELYQDARAALREADVGESGIEKAKESVSRARWRAARRMAELHDQGDSQRTIAAELRMNDRTVGRYIRVWEDYGQTSAAARPHFSNALEEVRGGWGHDGAKTTAKKVELAAQYLKDREVWKAPEVQKAVRSGVNRDVYAEGRERTANVPRAHSGTNISVLSGGYWQKFSAQLVNCDDAVKDALRELRRSGMPSAKGGEIIKRLRALSADVEKLEVQLSEKAIGA
jgi:hypothetical protein